MGAGIPATIKGSKKKIYQQGKNYDTLFYWETFQFCLSVEQIKFTKI